MSHTVSVIGAGFSGLLVARDLVSAGHEVKVFEAAAKPGGILGTQEADGFLIERSAGSFVYEEHGVAGLANELGVPLQEANDDAQKRWIFMDGALHVVPTGAKQLLTSRLIGWRGKMRVFTEPLQPTNPGADESVATFARRRLGEQITRALVVPFIRGIYGGDAETMSLRAVFPQVAALEGRGGLIRGIAAGKVEAVFSRMQGQSVATTNDQRLFAPTAGMESLISALAKELAPRIAYESTIASIEKHETSFHLHDAQGAHHPCDAVVLATPASVSASLVSPHHKDMARALREIPYVSLAIVSVGFRAKDIGHPLDGLGFLVGEQESLRLLGVLIDSTAWAGRAPEDCVLLRCTFGGAKDVEVLDLTDEELVELACRELDTVFGVTGSPLITRVARWPRATPHYTVGHTERVARVDAGAKELGLAITGSALRGASLNDCVKSAARTAAQVSALLAGVCLLFFASFGCARPGSSSSPGHEEVINENTWDASVDATATAVPVDDPNLPTDTGVVVVTARWPWPPAALRRSLGRNSCGDLLRPRVTVALMGGLKDVVLTSDVGAAPGDAQLYVVGCAIKPRVSVVGVGMDVQIQNLDIKPHDLVAETMDMRGVVTEKVHMPMRLVGQTYAVKPDTPGMVRVYTKSDPTDVAYVLVSEAAAVVTAANGTGELVLPVGSQTIRAWHPPMEKGKQGLEQTASVKVVGHSRSRHTISLAMAR